MSRKAFTLIEVMVVLSILAIIAILAYNFFGSTMKEATDKQLATNLFKNMVEAEGAYEEYTRITGGRDDSWYYNVANQQTFKDEAVSLGIVRIFPNPDPKVGRTCSNVWGPLGDGWVVGAQLYNFGGPSATSDIAISLNCITDTACQAFNKYFSPEGDTLPTDTDINILNGIRNGTYKTPGCFKPSDSVHGNRLYNIIGWR